MIQIKAILILKWKDVYIIKLLLLIYMIMETNFRENIKWIENYYLLHQNDGHDGTLEILKIFR